ncbi:hypothetical protein CEP53_013681 [Fusarium sp. AF-6]|nr:hypothetical protein CEP53_013681 [Fusarium sp. AF-6]
MMGLNQSIGRVATVGKEDMEGDWNIPSCRDPSTSQILPEHCLQERLRLKLPSDLSSQDPGPSSRPPTLNDYKSPTTTTNTTTTTTTATDRSPRMGASHSLGSNLY